MVSSVGKALSLKKKLPIESVSCPFFLLANNTEAIGIGSSEYASFTHPLMTTR
jgi:hypothetical protein